MKLQEIKDWKKYDPSNETDNKILSDDFRLLAAKYANEKAGKKTEYENVENVIKTAVKTVSRILELGKITFHPEQMKETSLELLKEVLGRQIKGGPYLVPPHGELIWDGKKKAIVKKGRLNKLEEMGILTSGKLAYGFLRTYEGEKINLGQFKEREKEHRISESEIVEAERKKWWGRAKEFWYYKIREFIKFDKPKEAQVPRGVQRWVRDVRFQESTFLPKDWDLQKLSNTELIQIHGELHDEARKFSMDTGKQPPEWMIDRHILITEELRRRKLEHRPHTELDRLAQKFGKTKEVSDRAIKLKDLMSMWQAGFDVRRPLLSFIGGACVSGWGEDIDINVNWPSWDDKFLDVLEFRLKSMVPPEYKERIHLVPDNRGPFTNFIPFATLAVKMLPVDQREVIKMSGGVLREQRITDVKMKQQANKSRKEDKLKLFRFFIQLKGIKGFKKEEAYSIEDAVEKVKERWVKDEKFPQIMVDQKFDGMRGQIHSDGKRVEIWSEDGGDLTNRFPSIVKEAKAQGIPFIADAEITGVKDKEHMGRSDVAGYAHAKTPVDDSPFTANVFDVPYIGEDIHKKILSERRSVMDKLKSGKAIKKADKKVVETEKELEDAMRNFAKIEGSEGAMLKLWDSPYELDGMTTQWMKFKKEVDLDAEVVDVKRVKGTDAYNYLCVIRERGKMVPVGRTFNVRFERDGKPIMVPIGGIIRVAFVNINKYTDPDTGEVWFNWWSPRAIEYREDKKRPDTVATANKLVKVTGGEIEEKKYPKRYRIALEKLKEGIQELQDYEDWLEESYTLLVDLDDYDYRLIESMGEDEFNEELKDAIKECEELGYYREEGDHNNEMQAKDGSFASLREALDIPASESTKQNLWEHHWRKEESVHADHRFKVNAHLNGWTIADQPPPGEVKKAKKALGIEGDIDSESDAKKLDKYLYDKKLWKFDSRFPERKVLCFPKASQPLVWLKFEGKVEPGTVGATEHGPGYFYHVEKGKEKEFGAQKAFFKEYFEHGDRYKGRWVVRKIPRRGFEKVGKAKLVWMAWFTKPDFESQIPYLLTRRGRTKKDYVPPVGLSGINKEWRDKVPAEFQWWKKGMTDKKKRLELMDKAFNWLADNLEEFPFRKLKEAVRDVKWTLSKAWWKGPTVVRGMPRVHWELFLDFGENKLKRFQVDRSPIFEKEIAGVLETENTKPDGDFKDWLNFEGQIEAVHPKNPNERLPVNYEIEDKGSAKFIERTDNFIHLNFKGKLFKGRKVLVREDPKSEIWILRPSTGPGGKR